jgi:hypothetical protein
MLARLLDAGPVRIPAAPSESLKHVTILALVPILAHEATWDSTLLAILPVVFFVWILYVANKRADAIRRDRAANAEYLEPPKQDTPPREL